MNNIELYSDYRWNNGKSAFTVLNIQDIYKIRVKTENGLKKIINAPKVLQKSYFPDKKEYVWKYLKDEVQQEISSQEDDYMISYFHNEVLLFVCYFNKQHQKHCLNGPAEIKYSPNSKILNKVFYINGDCIGENLNLSSFEEIQNYLILK